MEGVSDLFGGAIQSILPPQRVDVSEIREVPDNQEVFAHTQTDQSIIIEIMELHEANDAATAMKMYVEDMIDCTGANADPTQMHISSVDVSTLNLRGCTDCQLARGDMKLSKFKDTSENTVTLLMVLLRLPIHTTDILVTFNNPVAISPTSSSHGAESSQSTSAWTEQHFMGIVTSLTLVDPSLFG